MQPVPKCYLIEVPIPANYNGTKIQIPQQNFLDNTKVTGLEVFTADDVSKSPTQQPVITLADAKKAFLTLYTRGTSKGAGEYLQNIPLVRMHNQQNSTTDSVARYPLSVVPVDIDWSKSSLNLGATFTVTTGFSVLIMVYYQ